MSKLKLYKYQQDAIDFALKRKKSMIALKMGLGKTFTSLEWANQNISVNKVIIICQKAKVQDWVEASDSHFGKAIALTSKAKYEKLTSLEFDMSEVYTIVTTYDLFWKYMKTLKLRMNSQTTGLIWDESQKVKTHTSSRGHAAVEMSMVFTHVLLLSGSPQSVGYQDMYNQLRMMGYQLNYYAYLHTYLSVDEFTNTTTNTKFKKINGPTESQLKELIPLIHKYAIFTDYKKAGIDMPKETHIDVNVVSHLGYKTMSVFGVVDDIKSPNHGSKLMYLRQLSSGVLKDKLYSKNKITRFEELVESTNDRLIVFYNFKSELKSIKQVTTKLKRPLAEINGSNNTIETFLDTRNHNCVIAIQYQAGAEGIDGLQIANKTIYYSPTTSGGLFQQSQARTKRIGQTRPVIYYYLITTGSVEEKIYEQLKVYKSYTAEMFEKDDEGLLGNPGGE